MTKTPRPEDILPGDANFASFGENLRIRKGTMASLIVNCDTLKSPASTPQEKEKAAEIIKELAPALISFGLAKHFSPKSKLVQDVFDEALKNKNEQY